MSLKEVIELIVALLVIVSSIWAGTKFWRLTGQMTAFGKELGEYKTFCANCRADLLRHLQDTERHRDPVRDGRDRDELLERLKRIEEKIDARFGFLPETTVRR